MDKINESLAAEKRLDQQHSNGIYLAETHLTPFLLKLRKEQNYTRLEIASALMIIAYNVLRKERTKPIAKNMYQLLSKKSQEHIEIGEKNKLKRAH